MPPDTAVPSPDNLSRRLERERRARQEAESIAEAVTRELYDAVKQLQRTTAVVDETTDYVAISDAGGMIRYVNRAMGELLGVDLGDAPALDVTFVDLFSSESRQRLVREALPTVEEKGVWRGELVLVRPRDRLEIPVSQVLVGHRGPEGALESISSISRDITDRVALEQQLTHLALHDQLTQIPNRRLFFDRLDVALARAARLSIPIGIFYIDLDAFKPINDELGHRVGDEVLAATAQRLVSSMRPSDTVARLGGDEFAVLCEHVTNVHGASLIAGRLGEEVARPIEVNGMQTSVTASIGVVITSLIPEDGPGGLVRQADAAMYVAKRAGGARFHIAGRDPNHRT